MNDYSEITVTLPILLRNLEDALRSENWVLAASIAKEMESNLNQLVFHLISLSTNC